MWVYWFMFLVPAVLAVQEHPRRIRVSWQGMPRIRIPPVWWGVLMVLTLMVGLRHQVGGDWFNYLRGFENALDGQRYLDPDWWWNDPGYRLLQWIAMQMDWGIHGVNLLGAAVFSFGLVLFCRHLPRPWLALVVAMPYVVTVVGMGYTRQGIALGCIMAGLVALGHGRVMKFVIWAVVGATFHKTAVLLLPMAALAASRRRLTTWLWVGVVAAGSYVVLLQESVERFETSYWDAGMQSEGAFIRLLMNALPAALLLWKRERFAANLPQKQLWTWFAVVSLGLMALYFVTPSTTAVDRMALYLLPLQLLVFAYLPEALGRRDGRGNNQVWVFAVVAYYALVAFVWLNYATHAPAWLPYRFYPLEGVF
ncbi:EpsG family protein [Ectothiorhodospira shaposhnikovii]|uniref:EpsG family protein n=1 Tax=Ectothiorhodospira shaposhnikovii TaxID=1054 RepID=UPI001EE7A187|nr:EpsG family protein [Ectothiorhodospira shaposhnikovii]MCG5512749.1 EpsG family protein [Ectothiorhodospira shaposhnikovii]